MVICKPGSVTPHTKFKAEVYILSKEEGGRHTPFFNKYQTTVLFQNDRCNRRNHACLQELKWLCQEITLQLTVELIAKIAMEKGLRFAIREGGRTVGAGQVTEILD